MEWPPEFKFPGPEKNAAACPLPSVSSCVEISSSITAVNGATPISASVDYLVEAHGFDVLLFKGPAGLGLNIAERDGVVQVFTCTE